MFVPQKEEYFFAYGTLRRDFRHEMFRVLARHADFVGRAEYQGKLYDVANTPPPFPQTKPAI